MTLPPNKRPRHVTEPMARVAAEKIVDELLKLDGFLAEDRDGIVDDIASLRTHYHEDGYKLARELEQCRHWECDMAVAEVLDGFARLCRRELEKAQRAWETENPMEPPFPVGTSVKTPSRGVGVITAIHRSSYSVRTPELPPGSVWIIPFEEVSAV